MVVSIRYISSLNFWIFKLTISRQKVKAKGERKLLHKDAPKNIITRVKYYFDTILSLLLGIFNLHNPLTLL